MEQPEGEAHVWYFNVDDFSRDLDLYTSYLSEEEIQRSKRFKFHNDRVINIMARSSLRIVSGRYMPRDSNSIDFCYGTYGKPQFNFPTDLNFNISHSGKLIVLAFVNNSEIGVDIEKVKYDFDVLNLADNFFSSTEIKMLRDVSQENIHKAFYRCWTRKESFIKAKGSGLSFPLASFSVSLDQNDAQLLRTEWNPLEKESWRLFSFEPTIGYVGALSVHSDVQNVIYREWVGLHNSRG